MVSRYVFEAISRSAESLARKLKISSLDMVCGNAAKNGEIDRVGKKNKCKLQQNKTPHINRPGELQRIQSHCKLMQNNAKTEGLPREITENKK